MTGRGAAQAKSEADARAKAQADQRQREKDEREAAVAAQQTEKVRRCAAEARSQPAARPPAGLLSVAHARALQPGSAKALKAPSLAM